MTVYCVLCKTYVPDKRARRGSHFCTDECRREYKRLRRQELAERKCRLCGRAKRKKKEFEVVRPAHNELRESVEDVQPRA